MRSATLLPTTAAALALCGATAAGAPAAKTPTRNLKVTGGTTSLVLAPTAVTNLQAAGVALTGTAPGTTNGSVLSFPIKSGTMKVKGQKVLSGKIVLSGGLTMSRDVTNIALADLAVLLGAKPAFSGHLGALAVDIGTIKIPASKTKVTKKRVTLTKVSARLTDIAAGAMNGAFSVTSFKGGDLLGAATVQANVRLRK